VSSLKWVNTKVQNWQCGFVSFLVLLARKVQKWRVGECLERDTGGVLGYLLWMCGRLSHWVGPLLLKKLGLVGALQALVPVLLLRYKTRSWSSKRRTNLRVQPVGQGQRKRGSLNHFKMWLLLPMLNRFYFSACLHSFFTFICSFIYSRLLEWWGNNNQLHQIHCFMEIIISDEYFCWFPAHYNLSCSRPIVLLFGI